MKGDVLLKKITIERFIASWVEQDEMLCKTGVSYRRYRRVGGPPMEDGESQIFDVILRPRKKVKP